MRYWIKAAFVVAGMAFAPPMAFAQEEGQGPLVANLAVERVEIDEESKEEVMAPAENANPGDVLQYTGRYTNVSEEPLTGLIINGPIPGNTILADEGLSASQEANFEVLIEGEEWQALPAMKTITLEDGSTERVAAEPSDYREIRWRLDGALEPEATLVTVYRVRVSQ